MTSQPAHVTEKVSHDNLLKNFTAKHRNQLPVLVRLLDWNGTPTVLKNHKVFLGTELVLHGWTRQSKILATAVVPSTGIPLTNSSATASNSVMYHYAIPLTYQGVFQLRNARTREDLRSLNGVDVSYRASDLVNLPYGKSVIISNMTTDDVKNNPGLKVGNVLYVNSVRGYHPNSVISCEKLDENGNLTAVNISSKSAMTFGKNAEKNKDVANERINHVPTGTNQLEGGINGKVLTIRDLVPYLNATRDAPLEVELVKYGVDKTDEVETDLPLMQPIVLRGLVVEPAVYTSIRNPAAPSFHIPMRAPIYVRLVRSLDRHSSPLLTKVHPKLSTLDRCVELLTPGTYKDLSSQSQQSMPVVTSSLTRNGVDQGGTLRSLSSSAVQDRAASQGSVSSPTYDKRSGTQRSLSHPSGDRTHVISSAGSGDGASTLNTEFFSKEKSNKRYEQHSVVDHRTAWTTRSKHHHKESPSIAESEIVQSRSLWSLLSSRKKKKVPTATLR